MGILKDLVADLSILFLSYLTVRVSFAQEIKNRIFVPECPKCINWPVDKKLMFI
jgi:hypothetical protein